MKKITGILSTLMFVSFCVTAHLPDPVVETGLNEPKKNFSTSNDDPETVGLFYDSTNPQISFAAGDVLSALKSGGHTVEVFNLAALSASYTHKKIVIATESNPAVKSILSSQGGTSPSSLGKEGYSLHTTTAPAQSYWAFGGDSVGAMYGGLDIAESIQLYGLGPNLSRKKSPYIARRGLKYHLDLDSRAPSYTGGGTSPNESIEYNWDMDYWKSYLDDMARHRMNIIFFWSLNPFPSMVRVPEYPKAALDNVMRTTATVKPNGWGHEMITDEVLDNLVIVKTMTMDQKIKFWQDVMQYAYDRGVRFFFHTWNVYTYGTERTYPELKNHEAIPNTDYYFHTVKAFLRTYPLVKGLGTYPSEGFEGQLKGNYPEIWKWLFNTYGKAINVIAEEDPNRDLEYVAGKGTQYRAEIDNVFEGKLKVPYNYDDKYTDARFLSVTKPLGNSDIFTHNGRKFFCLLRDDDSYMFRWYDPEFMKEFMQNLPVQHITGLEMGANLVIYGSESGERNPLTPRQTFPQKHWFKYSLMGRLSYDPELSVQLFKDMLAKRHPDVSGEGLHEAWVSASRIGQLMATYVYRQASNDQHWMFEANYCRKGSDGYANKFKMIRPIKWYGEVKSHPNGNITTVSEYKAGKRGGIEPLQLADLLDELGDKAMASKIGESAYKETQKTLGDIRSKANLGYYYADVIRAAFYKETGKAAEAIKAAGNAVCHWKNYACWVNTFYEPVRLTRFWNATKDVNNGYTDITYILNEVILDYQDLGGTGIPDCPDCPCGGAQGIAQ